PDLAASGERVLTARDLSLGRLEACAGAGARTRAARRPDRRLADAEHTRARRRPARLPARQGNGRPNRRLPPARALRAPPRTGPHRRAAPPPERAVVRGRVRRATFRRALGGAAARR